jgi:uroporphyrinogen-III decarboxylase
VVTNIQRFASAVARQPVDRTLTYDLIDNAELLVRFGGYDPSKQYSFEEMAQLNARSFKKLGVDVTRAIFDPAKRSLGSKILNWIRFFRVNPDNWEISQKGGTTWLAKRPFSNLAELEKNMPSLPRYEEVKEWYEPVIRYLKEVFDYHDVVLIGSVDGPITDAYRYMDMETFFLGLYDAPEIVSHVMDCMGRFSSYVARVFAENATAPLLFMGEDIAGSNGPLFSPAFIRDQALPRWRWIQEPIREKGYKFLFHSDGRYGDLLQIIFDELGADGINPIERNGCNDIFAIRKSYPDKLLFGNVCCEVTLPYGTVYDVEDETLELLERLGSAGGILIGSSSEVHDLVPVENAVALYSTVHEYGHFPVDVQRIRDRRRNISGRLTIRRKVG